MLRTRETALIGLKLPANYTNRRELDPDFCFIREYLRNSQFAVPTYYEDELIDIVAAKVPVHAFHVCQDAQKAFQDIALKTGGVTGALDIHSDKGAAMLTSLVTLRILENVNKFAGGGAVGEKKLKEAYHSKYGFV